MTLVHHLRSKDAGAGCVQEGNPASSCGAWAHSHRVWTQNGGERRAADKGRVWVWEVGLMHVPLAERRAQSTQGRLGARGTPGGEGVTCWGSGASLGRAEVRVRGAGGGLGACHTLSRHQACTCPGRNGKAGSTLGSEPSGEEGPRERAPWWLAPLDGPGGGFLRWLPRPRWPGGGALAHFGNRAPPGQQRPPPRAPGGAACSPGPP